MIKKCKIFSIYISLIFFSQLLHAENIEELLSKYEESADLSRKTRVESLGHYIVITRRELDLMQAYTLSDVLRSIKFHTYIPNRFGVYQLIATGSMPAVNTSYRLFIDDHEVSSIHTDNPFLMFDNYPLDGINHIEIYYGAGAVRLGNEPSLLIIKLYTKEPSRENTGVVRLSGSNRKDYAVSFNDARVIKPGISYNLMVNRSSFDFKPYRAGEKQLSRDTTGNYLFLKLNYFDTTLDLSYTKVNRDAYAGLAVDIFPDISKTKSEDIYINLTQNLLEDKSLKINLSVDINRREAEFSNDLQGGGVFAGWIYPHHPLDPARIPIYYYENRKFNKYSAYISKEIKTDRNTLLIGASYKVKENNVEEARYSTISETRQLPQISPFTKTLLTTVFIENQYNLTDRSLVFTSLKYDHNERNGGYRDISDYIARLGFVNFFSNNLFLKGFLTRTYIPPSFFEVEISENLTDLKQEKIYGASFEVGYNLDKHSLNIFYGYADADRMIAFVPYARNLDKSLIAHYLSFDYEYRPSTQAKIMLNIYKSFNNFNDFSSTDGGSIKIYMSTDSLDIYNELVYRKGFKIYGKKMDDSFNYNIALKYKASRDLTIGFRGDNLLDSSPKSVFVAGRDIFGLPSFDRRFMLSIEKVF